MTTVVIKKCVYQLLLFLVMMMSSTIICAAAAVDAGYTTRQVPVYDGGEETGMVELRFYEEKPDVACIGLNEYFQMRRGYSVEVEKGDDGIYTIVSPGGGTALVDTNAGTIFSEAWPVFTDYPLPQEGSAKGYLDAGCGFVRITDIEYVGEDVPLTFDLGKYGISIYGDEDDVYLPLSTASNLLSDIATNYAIYNGEKVLLSSIVLDTDTSSLPAGYYSDWYTSMMKGEDRPEDLIDQSYADICLAFDTMFGHPGKAVMDADMKKKGLEQAVTDMGAEGKEILENMKSPDYATYVVAFTKMINKYLNDGHTQIMSLESLIATDPMAGLKLYGAVLSEGNALSSISDSTSINLKRNLIWGNETYREAGNIGIIRLDNFGMDRDGWKNYYENGGPVPKDAFGITVSGLRKAAENPEIDTILFDLTTNSGGSSDELMGIMSLLTDQYVLTGKHPRTGQTIHLTFETDRNLDGVFDEKDLEVHYDYKLAVMTTHVAFSCGNLFPILMQENGAVLLGEPTSGGSCCVQMESTLDGCIWVMSSYLMSLVDSEGLSVEGGCKTDLPIECKKSDIPVISKNTGVALSDYSQYYNDESLIEMINGWYEDTALSPAA